MEAAAKMIRNRAERQAAAKKPRSTKSEKAMGLAAELLKLRRERAAKLKPKIIPLKRKKAT
jgi:hypothetical protein